MIISPPLKPNQKLRFNNIRKSGFFADVRQKVDAYFTERDLDKKANGAMWLKAFVFLSGYLLLAGLILSNQFSPLAMLFMAIGLGLFSAFIGFNICHDAIHGALSNNARVNKIFSVLFHFIGANPYVWNITHNVVHHTYTNIAGHDEDLEIAPGLIRLSTDEKLTTANRYQHWYGFALYSLASLSWVFRKDYKKFFQDKVGEHPTPNHPKIEYFNLFFFKFLYYFLFLVLPVLVTDITWWQGIIGFLALHFAQGLVMGLVFQLAHVVEGTEFPTPNEQGNIEEAWAEHQMRTTANFSMKSKLSAFLLGGLNQQIEHHLFPKICHIHYPAISAIVADTAKEYNLPYIQNETFGGALISHYRMLKRYSRD